MDMREREQKEATARFRTVHGYGRFGEESKSVKYDNKNGPELEGNSLENTTRLGWDRTTDASFRAVMVWHDLGRIQPWKLL